MIDQNFQHWHLEIDRHHVAWISLDKEGSAVNTIDLNVLNELKDILDYLETQSFYGVIFSSAKTSGFVAGADINMFQTLKNADDINNFLHFCHGLFDRIENLSVPTVCLIDGFCLGGGLELSLKQVKPLTKTRA